MYPNVFEKKQKKVLTLDMRFVIVLVQPRKKDAKISFLKNMLNKS